MSNQENKFGGGENQRLSPEATVQLFIKGMNDKRTRENYPAADFQIQRDEEGNITGVVRIREDSHNTITPFYKVEQTVQEWNAER